MFGINWQDIYSSITTTRKNTYRITYSVSFHWSIHLSRCFINGSYKPLPIPLNHSFQSPYRHPLNNFSSKFLLLLMSGSLNELQSIWCCTLLTKSLFYKSTKQEPFSRKHINLLSPNFIFFKVSFSFLFKLFLCFQILVGLNKSFSTASIKGSKLLHFAFFLSGII